MGLPQSIGRQPESFSQQEDRLEETPVEFQRAQSAVAYLAQLITDIPQPYHRVICTLALGETLWPSNRSRAREYFRLAFSTINQVEGSENAEPGDGTSRQRRTREIRHQLRLQALNRVSRLDRLLARELIDQIQPPEIEATPDPPSLSSEELMDLATVLLEHNPEDATTLAQESLDQGLSPDFGSFLDHLAQTDPDSARQLFDASLEASVEEHETSLDGLLSLLNYAFPDEAQEATRHDRSLDQPRATQLLDRIASILNESDWASIPDQDADWDSEIFWTERLSLIEQVLPLFEQYAPDSVPALETTSHQLADHLQHSGRKLAPPRSQNSRLAETLGEQIEIPVEFPDRRIRDQFLRHAALSSAYHGDPDRAEQFLQRIEDSYLQGKAHDAVHMELALQALADNDLARMRRQALELSQAKHRVAVYAMAAEELARQGGYDGALFWLYEAWDTSSQLKDSPEKVQSLFRLIDTALSLDASLSFDLMQSAVVTLNRVHHHARPASWGQGLAQSSLEQYIAHSFNGLGSMGFDRALYLAMQLEPLDTRILAELATCRVVLLESKHTLQQ